MDRKRTASPHTVVAGLDPATQRTARRTHAIRRMHPHVPPSEYAYGTSTTGTGHAPPDPHHHRRLYTLAGLAALAIGFVIPSDGPLSAVFALMLGMPWTFVLSRLNGYVEDSYAANVLLVTGAIAVNAALLWWLALSRRRTHRQA